MITACHLGMEPVISKGTLMTSDPSLKKINLLKETTSFTNKKQNNSGKREILENSKISGNNVEESTSSLLQDLFRTSALTPLDLDFLSTTADFFEKIKKPEEIHGLDEKIFRKIINEQNLKPAEIKLKSPTISANETKCGKIVAGTQKIIKTHQLNTIPDLILDISTYSSGITYNTKEKRGLLTGLGMEIIDALARGHSEIDRKKGTVLQLPDANGKVYEEETKEFVLKSNELINITRIPSGKKRVGKVPVNVEKAYDDNIKLFGCDVGVNGNELNKITQIGRKAASYGTSTLKAVVNRTLTRLIGKIIKKFYEEELISTNPLICISTRNNFSQKTIEGISKHLEEIGYGKNRENLLFLNNPASFGFFKKPFCSFKS